MAKDAAIDAAQGRIIECDGSSVVLIRRFDRLKGGQRLMYISAATMLGIERNDPQEHFYTEIVDAIRVHGAQAQADIEQLWRRIAFSVLITNIDDHLLNHGFLHETRDQLRLAPAFDLNPFPERIRELKTWISEQAGPHASIEGLMSAIAYFRITQPRAKEIMREVEQAVRSWRKKGRIIGMTEFELDQFADAFEHCERAAERNLAAN